MRPRNPFDLVVQKPVIIGSGLIALDVVMNEGRGEQTRLWAGGTCGNVLTILSYLGWAAYPVARLNGDAASKLVAEDLSRWEVHRDFANLQPGSRTPIVVQRIRQDGNGMACHRFSRKCPICGNWLPGYTALPASLVEGISTRVNSPKVFFFDRVSSGTLSLAKVSAENGAIVFFEPSNITNPRLFKDALALSHVLKYSQERMSQYSEILEASNVLLRIETLGKDGLRYKSSIASYETGDWKYLDAYKVNRIRDTAGAGDWLTAGIIHLLGQMGLEGLQRVTSAGLMKALRFGQSLAAWNCGFEGARGGMYVTDRETFRAEIGRVMSGHESLSAIVDQQALAAGEIFKSVCPSCNRQ